MNENAAEALKKWKEEGGVVKSRQEKFKEKPTRKLAIDLMCVFCVGGEEEAGYRQTIRECTSWNCPLREFRPYK